MVACNFGQGRQENITAAAYNGESKGRVRPLALQGEEVGSLPQLPEARGVPRLEQYGDCERETAKPGVWELFCGPLRLEGWWGLLCDRHGGIRGVWRTGGEDFSGAAVVGFFAMAVREQRDGETGA